MNHEISLLPLPKVEERVGIKKSKIYELIRTDNFPQPVRLGRRNVRWRSDDIQKWIDALTSQQQVEVAA